MDYPRNEAELRQVLETGANDRYVVQLDPRTNVEISRTIEIQQADPSGEPWGVNGNYAKITWAGGWNEDMLVYKGWNGGGNRCLTITGLQLFGNGYAGAAAGACLKLYAPDGDPGSIYKFTLRDIFTSYATYGIVLEGAVFEGMMDNCHAENHLKDGILTKHMNVGQNNQAIVSNIQMLHPNSSRNFGAGIRTVYSTNVFMGSFVNNALGGVIAEDGLRYATLCNGENTGESVFVVPNNGYGSTIVMNEGSTNATTVARKYENGAWVDVGKPMLYVLDIGRDVVQDHNHISTYGAADGNPAVRVVK